MKILLLLLLVPWLSAHEQHAQHSEWFNSQKVPAGPRVGQSCCSDNDGAFARERLQDGKLQVQWFDKNTNQTTDYIDVPDDTVIMGKRSPTGEPTVWWGYQNGKQFIRCFIPGIRV